MSEKVIKTEKEKMLNEEFYNASGEELTKEREYSKDLCYDYNHTRPSEKEKLKNIIKKLFKSTGENYKINPPFFCDYGYNISIGENFYSNYNLIILDVCEVSFGNNVFIGPNVGIYTAGHPVDVELRNNGVEYGKKIKIGNNVWIGGNVTILPGVTIGDNVTIGAGAVVTKDIPPNVTAFGNPCKVHKKNKDE